MKKLSEIKDNEAEEAFKKSIWEIMSNVTFFSKKTINLAKRLDAQFGKETDNFDFEKACKKLSHSMAKDLFSK